MDTGSPKYVENQYDPENDLPSPPPQYSTGKNNILSFT